MKKIFIIFLFLVFANISFSAENEMPLKVEEDHIAIMDGGKEIGRLEWKNGKLEFKGDSEKSGKIFFEKVLKPKVDEYMKKNHKKHLEEK